MRIKLIMAALLVAVLLPISCYTDCTPHLKRYCLDSDTQGVIEKINNIYNTCIVSNDPNVYKAEYEAGFIQGKLQGEQIVAARDNQWDTAFLISPSHYYPKQIPPSQDELAIAQRTLKINWEYTLDYIRRYENTDVGRKLRRLMYRLIGIYHGAARQEPEPLNFNEQWCPSFFDREMTTGYETSSVTFMDIYFINSVGDIFDILPDDAPPADANRPGKCSAFARRTQDDIFLSHNSWYSYLSQSQALTLWINGDFMTVNTVAPGSLSSNTDFGYNNKGIIFNETTHSATYSEPKVTALWMFWRAALAEQFSESIDQFFHYVSLEPSGTYMNGYMIIDAKTKEIGLVEMSYKNFVFFKSDASGEITIRSKPEGLNKEYDSELVQPHYLLGINYPASYQIRDDLKAQDTRPARKQQFLEQINSVTDIESAKALITYTDPANPLSIFGRWDLGYGETPKPKTVPDGSIDAKSVSVSMIKDVSDLKGVLDTSSSVKAFWMKFGTPYISGKPFIWSQSQWKGWKLRFVPDRLDGDYTLLSIYLK